MTYTPPGGPTPPTGPAAGASPKSQDRTVLWGWLGIIVGLLCCGILGVVFGVLSIRDAERYGNSRTLGYIAVAASLVNVLAGAFWGLTVNR